MQELDIVIMTKEDRKLLFTELYKRAFPSVAAYVSKMSGNLDDAKDIFQDALVIYYEKIQEPSFEIQTSEKAYVLGICKNLWNKRFAENQTKLYEVNDRGDNEELGNISSDKLLGFLAHAGKKCMEILKAFYYDQQDASQIASVFGYSGGRSATVQKFKCLEKVRDQVKQKSLGYEDFTE